MKKRLLTSLFCLFLLFTLLLPPAQASASAASGALARIHSIEQQNNRCGFQDILKATGVKIINEANDRIEAVIIQSCRLAEKAKTDAEIRAIICSMLTRTKSISITARAAAAVCGGGGGGRPNMAQAGGKDASKIADALEKAKEIIAEQMK